MDGWIKLHRKILNWEWYDDINTKVLFLHLLLTANHKEQKWRGQTILRGQKLTSIQHLADETQLTPKQVRVALDKLKMTNEVATKGTNKYTLITIEKYSDYQDYDEEKGKQNNEQQDKQRANKGQTKGKQRATNKNDKNIKKEEEEKEEDIFLAAADENYIKFYMQNINPLITPYEAEMLNSYSEDLDNGLMIQAMKDAIEHKARNFAYIKKILDRYVNQGIKTKEQLDNLKSLEEKPKDNQTGITFREEDLTPEQLDAYLNNKMTKEELKKILEAKDDV